MYAPSDTDRRSTLTAFLPRLTEPLTSEHVRRILRAFNSTDTQVQVAVQLFPLVSDPAAFDSTVVRCRPAIGRPERRAIAAAQQPQQMSCTLRFYNIY